MQHTVLLPFCLFAFVVLCPQTHGRVPLDDFFPFGSAVGDSRMHKNDDESVGPIALPYIFPYFDNNHRQIYVANNGLFSFLGGISEFNPVAFPLGDDRRLITPFWSDIDTRGATGNWSDNAVYYQVHTRQTSGSSAAQAVLAKASAFVRLYFARERPFEPLMAVVATWYRVGAYNSQTNRLNTFQMVIATDELRSFTFFLYHDLQWAGQAYVTEPYGQAGFNAGDGISSTMLPHSRTRDIVRLVNESNVNVDGLFAFRIDTVDIEAGGCSSTATNITFQPNRGSQIGDTAVNFQGPCFETNAPLMCRFGAYGSVPGVVLSQYRARCLSPTARTAGQVPLEVSFDNGTTYQSIGQFSYTPMNNELLLPDQLVVQHNGVGEHLLSWNEEVDIEWFYSETTFESFPVDEVAVDIEYELYRTESASTNELEKSTVLVLATGIRPRAGRQSIHVNLSAIAEQERFIPVLPALGMGAIRVVARHVVRQAVKYIVKKAMKYVARKGAEYACDEWSGRQPNPSTWSSDLPSCPNTLRQASVAVDTYEFDSLCRLNGLPLVNCWFHQGRPQFNEDNAVACVRSRASNAHGAGSQCCYNANGEIITRGTGAGSDDRYHSKNNFLQHQIQDVLPFIACCKLQEDPERCNNYGKHRPARPGSNINSQTGGTWGDPHFLTLDGTPYTFNGYGEYVYLSVLEQQASSPSAAYNFSAPTQFLAQIRTAPLSTNINDVTVIKAFAARVGANTISITVSRRNQLLVHFNGELLALERDPDAVLATEIVALQLDDFFIMKNLSSNEFTLSWSVGVSMEITPTPVSTASSLVLSVAATISGSFKGYWTYGLIGGYDGNPTNDLRSSSGTVVGTVDSLTTQEIHELFGVTWAIAPTRSLFFYESGDNATHYATQNHLYRPSFHDPSAATAALDSAARTACGIPASDASDSNQWTAAQRTCYYDAIATGDVSFGRMSRQAAEQQVEQREAMRNPPSFDTNKVPLRISVHEGQSVNLGFSATSEFSTSIAYRLLNGPIGAKFDPNSGQFEWHVPTKPTQRQFAVKVSAEDATYHLVSTHEVVLDVTRTGGARKTFVSTVLTFAMLVILTLL